MGAMEKVLVPSDLQAGFKSDLMTLFAYKHEDNGRPSQLTAQETNHLASTISSPIAIFEFRNECIKLVGDSPGNLLAEWCIAWCISRDRALPNANASPIANASSPPSPSAGSSARNALLASVTPPRISMPRQVASRRGAAARSPKSSTEQLSQDAKGLYSSDGSECEDASKTANSMDTSHESDISDEDATEEQVHVSETWEPHVSDAEGDDIDDGLMADEENYTWTCAPKIDPEDISLDAVISGASAQPVDGGKTHIMFAVNVRVGAIEYTIARQAVQFIALHEELQSFLGSALAVPEFPNRTVTKSAAAALTNLGSAATDVTAVSTALTKAGDMTVALHKWLTEVLRIPTLACSAAVRNFLEANAAAAVGSLVVRLEENQKRLRVQYRKCTESARRRKNRLRECVSVMRRRRQASRQQTKSFKKQLEKLIRHKKHVEGVVEALASERDEAVLKQTECLQRGSDAELKLLRSEASRASVEAELSRLKDTISNLKLSGDPTFDIDVLSSALGTRSNSRRSSLGESLDDGRCASPVSRALQLDDDSVGDHREAVPGTPNRGARSSECVAESGEVVGEPGNTPPHLNSKSRPEDVSARSRLFELDWATLSGASVLDIEGSRRHVVYAVQVHMRSGISYTLSRRFRQFFSLHKQLEEAFPAMDHPTFPPRWLSPGSKMAEREEMERRMPLLAVWLQRIMKSQTFRSCPEVLAFLEVRGAQQLGSKGYALALDRLIGSVAAASASTSSGNSNPAALENDNRQESQPISINRKRAAGPTPSASLPSALG